MDRDFKEALKRMKFGKKKELSEIFNELVDYVEEIENEKDRARKRLNEFNKDSKIQELENEITRLRENSIAILSEKEEELYKQFSHEHYEKCKSRLGISYIVTPTGIGSNIKIKCNACGEEKDITDYDMW